MVDVLSQYTTGFFYGYPRPFKYSFAHSTLANMSYNPTNYDSVEYVVAIFCFLLSTNTGMFSQKIIPPL